MVDHADKGQSNYYKYVQKLKETTIKELHIKITMTYKMKNINKEVDTITKNQTANLELKRRITQMKYSLEGFKSIAGERKESANLEEFLTEIM